MIRYEESFYPKKILSMTSTSIENASKDAIHDMSRADASIFIQSCLPQYIALRYHCIRYILDLIALPAQHHALLHR